MQKSPAPFPWKFFILSFVFTWICWSPGWLATLGLFELPVPFLVFFFIGTWGPFAAASWLTYREEGKEGLRSFWRRGIDFSFPKVWLLVILFVALLVSAVPLGAHLLLGGAKPEPGLLANPIMILPVFLTYFFTGGGNEEWGWRGYALDRLQSRWSPLKASLVLGVIWGFWHLPLFFIEYTGQYHLSLLLFMLFTPAMSILHSWVYNAAGRSLLAAWLLHAAMGAAWEVFPNVQPNVTGFERVFVFDHTVTTVLALAVVTSTREKLGLKEE